MSFRQHTESLGIQLLRDDILYIKRQLVTIPNQLHRQVLTEYCDYWLDAMNSCNNELKRMNIGRRVANTWLRETNHGK